MKSIIQAILFFIFPTFLVVAYLLLETPTICQKAAFLFMGLSYILLTLTAKVSKFESQLQALKTIMYAISTVYFLLALTVNVYFISCTALDYKWCIGINALLLLIYAGTFCLTWLSNDKIK